VIRAARDRSPRRRGVGMRQRAQRSPRPTPGRTRERRRATGRGRRGVRRVGRPSCRRRPRCRRSGRTVLAVLPDGTAGNGRRRRAVCSAIACSSSVGTTSTAVAHRLCEITSSERRCAVVERDAEHARGRRTHPRSHERAVLADAGGEHERVTAARAPRRRRRRTCGSGGRTRRARGRPLRRRHRCGR
jgi:hypothetical protein